MISAWSRSARAFAALVAVLAVVLTFGLAGSASAADDNAKTTGKGADVAATTPANDNGTKTTTTEDTSDSGKDPADHQTSGNAGTSGTATEPQPLSNADQNEGGANGECPDGPYCSTRDGSASENGKGDGEATGKPCAGCVGKADNKNPGGQYPDADNDGNMNNANENGNAGYECDRNQGIAQGNPAHTGCESDTPPPTTGGEEFCPGTTIPIPPGGIEECENGEGPKFCPGTMIPIPPGGIEECDEDVTPPTIGGEETPPGANRPPTVAGVEQFAGPNPPAGVEMFAPPAAAGAAAAGVLPSTGATTLTNAFAATGLGLLLLGAAILLYRRVSHS